MSVSAIASETYPYQIKNQEHVINSGLNMLHEAETPENFRSENCEQPSDENLKSAVQHKEEKRSSRTPSGTPISTPVRGLKFFFARACLIMIRK